MPATQGASINPSAGFGTNMPKPNLALPNNLNQKKVEQKEELGFKQNPVQKFFRESIGMAEMLAAAPLMIGSFLEQAQNMADVNKAIPTGDFMGFISKTVGILASPLRYLQKRFVLRDYNEGDVKANQRGFLGDDVLTRLSHPDLVREFISSLFLFRRVIFNLFPKVFIVPSREHDTSESNTKTASLASKNFFSILSRATSFPRVISSCLAGLALIPGNFAATISAFVGDQKNYLASKSIAKFSNLLAPVVSNFSSLYSSARAYIESYREPKSKSVTFGRYNISGVHVFQGILGSLLAIPYLPGLAKKLFELIRKDSGKELASNLSEVAEPILQRLSSNNFFSLHFSVAEMKNNIENFVFKYTSKIKDVVEEFSGNVNGLTGFLNLFSNTNIETKAQQDDKLIQINYNSDKYLWGFLPKAAIFDELYHLIHPIQSLLMLLPNAIVPINDPYITDNSKKSLRMIDRFLGLNSMILSLPNYLMYAFSTRVPQLVLKYFEFRQRHADNNSLNYDAYKSFNSFVASIKRIPILSFLGSALEKQGIRSTTFNDTAELTSRYNSLDEMAIKQEPSVKASELLGAVRIGFRTLLLTRFGQKVFRAGRDAEGLTPEEQSSKKIYDSLGTFKEGLGRLPFVGLIAGPLIETFRSLYKVNPKTNLNLLPS
ncbi:MAG: hypothetical protein LW817_06195 [Candidatus Caenarcaniphilales bacterium]|jgi:hypothetical protein|nr:hypothetical protein [Candidatus Caenarcaniphilales bacterium]